MNALIQYQACTCKKMGLNPPLCSGLHAFEENGKRVFCTPKQGETVTAIQLDGCVLTDNNLKCDGVFVWQARNKAAVLLVELKGAGDIAHAFEQLAFVKNNRREYRQLKNCIDAPQILEKAFVVSSGAMSKPEKEKLEDAYNLRVAAVIHTEATKAVPDLRDYL